MIRRSLGTARLVLVLGIAGCGPRGGLSGRYAEASGIGALEFREDGTVYVSYLGATVAGEYELDGARVIVRGPNGAHVLTRNGERLEGAVGLIYLPERGAR